MENSNRIIKFRAWDETRKQMGQVSFICNQDLDKIRYWFRDEEFSGYTTTIKLMQYTGLKDKNGKEIYEGDIVKGVMEAGAGMQSKQGKECLFVVTVITDGWGDKFNLKQITELKGDYRTFPNFKNTEVVGNVYENKELLD